MALRLVRHEGSGQGAACLGGLVRYAERIARTPQVRRFATEQALVAWLYAQPVKLDEGDGPTEAGCSPPQRSRAWPRDGLNCWEATAHYVGWHIAQRSNVTVHLYDVAVKGQRHVFPAVEREPGAVPQPVLLQPPIGGVHTPVRLSRAQHVALAQGLRLVGSQGFDYTDSQEKRTNWLRQLARGARVEEWHEGKPPENVLAMLPIQHRGLGYIARTKWESLLYVSLRPDGWGTRYYLIEVGPELLGGAPSGAPPGGAAPGGPDPGAAPPGRLPPGAPPANAIGNDIFGGVHLVGDKLLRAFGLGGLSDTIASTAGDELPDWARTQEQKNQREREQLEAQKLELQKQKAEAEQRDHDRREKEALALRAIEEAQRSREQLARQKQEQAAAQLQVMAAQPEPPPAAHQPGDEAAPSAAHAPAQGVELSDSENPCGSTVFGPAAFTLEVAPP